VLQRIETDVMFPDPNDVNEASAALIEHGFDVEVLDDWIDDYSRAVWIKVGLTTELDANRFLRSVSDIVTPLGGDAW
jgi:hypothetical protein